MYRSYESYNFLRLLLPLIAGIVCYLFLGIIIPFAKTLLTISFIISFFIVAIAKLKKLEYTSVVFGLSLNILLFVAGNYLSVRYDASNNDNFFAHFRADSKYIKLQIDEPFVKKGNYYKSKASILTAYYNEESIEVTGKTFINIKNEENLNVPKYGDVLLAQNKLFEIKGAKNLGEFNYKRYANLKQIHFQAYFTTNDYTVFCNECGSKLWANIYKVRVQLVNALIKNIEDETTLAITTALLLGQKNYLTKTVKATFANTGAMHILAVSGLHVGMLFLILNYLFKPIAGKRWGRAVAAILSVLVIWLYAGITGFSASVTRASLMFSLFLVADIVNRDKNTYNILAASAFLILLYQPNMIAEVGFQLSYAAVFSIVSLYPYIYKWFLFQNKIVNFFWSISAVSIAAQIGTMPISLYYFNQFPTTFLFSNLVAIPAAFAIFGSGIAILGFNYLLPPLAILTGYFLEIIVGTLHLTLSSLNKVPFSTIEFNSFSAYFPFVAFLLFTGLIVWLINQNRKALWLAAFCLFLLCGSHTLKKMKSFNEEKLLVYNNNNSLIMETLASGTSIGNISKSDISSNIFEIDKAVHQYFQVSNQFQFDYPNINNLYQIKDKTVFILNDEVKIDKLPLGVKVDVLVIENSPYINDFKTLLNKIELKEVVITSNNKNANYYLKQFDKYNVKCYSVKNEGMYVANLN